MCDEDIAKSFKQRFKGIENFLRRVAFNLGNSASQTEVKIISCIPIDVTDLQQKIVNLEKELQDVKGSDKNITSGDVSKRAKTSEKTTAFNATVPETCLRGPEIYDSKANIDKSVNPDKQSKNIFCPNQQDSDVSFVFSALSLGSCGQQTKTIGDTDCSKQPIQQSKRRNIFRRKRKVAREEKQKPKTHFVYYAETINPLLLSRNLKSQAKPQIKKDIFSTHLSKIMRKQYDSRFGIEEFSDTSHFTRPICKDIDSPVRNDSDICSCCYGRFQNIDNYMGNGINLMIERDRSYVKTKDFNKGYYDSKFYDIVPVKEISESSVKKHQKAIPKTFNNMNCHKTPRNKYQIDPITLNYRAETYRRYQTRQDVHQNEPIPSHSKRQKYLQKKNLVYEDTSRSFSVNCGSIYTKRVLSPKVTVTRDQAMTNERENHITFNINSKDNLGKTSKSIQLEVDLLNDTKTETMLNQIKSILQSVLTEVKTNTQLNKGETVKKDAIVQKGSSENNITKDSANHFTYTAANPSFYSPYAQAYMPFGRVCFDNIPCQPVKCVQNSPYFMQSCQGRCKCSCQRKDNCFFKCDTPNAITTATNTNSHTTETNNLIQEIYKSVALNLDYLPKNNYSSSNYDNEKSETDMKSMVGESKVAKSDKEIEALLSMCTETSSQSEEKETKETLTDKKTNQEPIESKLYHLYRLEERNNIRNDNIRKQDLGHTYGDTESHSTVGPRSLNEKNKKGFFDRIAKFLRRRKVSQHDDNVGEEDCESSEESETDEYETVYSGSVNGSRDNNPPPHRTIYTKKKPRINIQVNGKRIRRSPYMEQEYRRHWNEDLTFGQNEQKDARDQAVTSKSVRYQKQYAPYRSNYEARSVIIHRDSSHDLAQYENAKEKKGFLKKHKLGLRCGEHWKNLILDN